MENNEEKNAEEYERKLERGRAIIKSNKDIINHMPAKYKYLKRALNHDGVRLLLLKVYSFVYQREFFIYERKYTFFLSSAIINNLRDRTTKSTSNHYINYLCAIGFINKLYQHLDKNGLVQYTNLSGVNTKYLLEHPDQRPINHFSFRDYQKKHELDRLEARAKRLFENGITPGNISKDMLANNGCEDIAKEVYPENPKESLDKKQRQYEALKALIDKQIGKKGYTTKGEIFERSKIPNGRIEKIFTEFRKDFQRNYCYKPPNKADRVLYKINPTMKKWIIVKGGGEATEESEAAL